jgi:hypothetical protein
MTIPDPTAPPATIGSQPKNASQVNDTVGLHLRQFLAAKAAINQDQDYFAATDLKLAPYYFTDAQETDLKTAISQLDAALDGVDLTFINRIVGMF